MSKAKVRTERLVLIRDGLLTRLKSGASGAPDLDQDIANALSELLALREEADGTKPS